MRYHPYLFEVVRKKKRYNFTQKTDHAARLLQPAFFPFLSQGKKESVLEILPTLNFLMRTGINFHDFQTRHMFRGNVLWPVAGSLRETLLVQTDTSSFRHTSAVLSPAPRARALFETTR